MSLVEFKTVEYEGSKQVIASDEIKERILKTGIRKVERETGLSHHTIDRILKGKHVRRKTLAKIVKQPHSSLSDLQKQAREEETFGPIL